MGKRAPNMELVVGAPKQAREVGGAREKRLKRPAHGVVAGATEKKRKRPEDQAVEGSKIRNNFSKTKHWAHPCNAQLSDVK